MVAEIREPGEKEGPSFKLHFEWKGKDSVMDCENLFKVKVARIMLDRQGIKSYLTEEEE